MPRIIGNSNLQGAGNWHDHKAVELNTSYPWGVESFVTHDRCNRCFWMNEFVCWSHLERVILCLLSSWVMFAGTWQWNTATALLTWLLETWRWQCFPFASPALEVRQWGKDGNQAELTSLFTKGAVSGCLGQGPALSLNAVNFVVDLPFTAGSHRPIDNFSPSVKWAQNSAPSHFADGWCNDNNFKNVPSSYLCWTQCSV